MEKYYQRVIATHRNYYNELLLHMHNAKSKQDKLDAAIRALQFAVFYHCGVHCSEEIEQAFIEIAQTLPYTPNTTTVKQKSFLHVVSEAYDFGGHTRVIERWIESAPIDEVHSVVQTHHDQLIFPERLAAAVAKKNGTVIRFKDDTLPLDKGMDLRKISESYECIILHIAKYDYVPLLAYGTTSFERPVIFFNHTDHMFMLGVSIADVVAEMREWGQTLSFTRKGVSGRSFILDLPIEVEPVLKKDKLAIRNLLGLPNKNIILTVGRALKYLKFLNYDFMPILKNILLKQPESVLVVVGPDRLKNKEWAPLINEFGSRVMVMGIVPHTELFDYYHACDVVLDSFPMSGGLAILDAYTGGCPSISLHGTVAQLDATMHAKGYCYTPQEFISTVCDVLSNSNFGDAVYESLGEELKRRNVIDVWREKVVALIEMTPEKHAIYGFKTQDNTLTDLDYYLVMDHFRELRKVKSVHNILEIRKKKILKKRIFSIKFLNKYYLLHS